MYVRGYVKNIPGAPMCACAEQMPTVSRADCTQIDFESKFFGLESTLGDLQLTLILTNVWQTKNMILSSRSKATQSPQDSPIYSSNSTHVKG